MQGGPDTGVDQTGELVSGGIGGTFYTNTGPYKYLGYNEAVDGSAICDGSSCSVTIAGSFSKTFTGADLAIFTGSGSLTYSDNSYLMGFGPFGSSTTTATVTFFTALDHPPSAPEPVTWAMMVGGFGLIGASMRRRSKVSFA